MDSFDFELDQNMPSFHAFKTLRDLVRSWAKEFLLHGSSVSELLLSNFYRWISSPSSKMYDSSLYAHIHGLMTKTLMQLLTEFTRLGAKVVYATFDRIIIVTTKTSALNAKAWSDFILKTI